MKDKIKLLVVLVGVFAVLAESDCLAKPAATLSISPSVISNTYTGVITLQISNILSGDEVQVNKYIDFDGSGVLQTNDLLVDSFKITDNGTDGIYGSITNVNVPVDTDSTTGAITTTLNFAPQLSLENMVGHYIYKVSSPVKDFSPATNTFVVTNASTGQSFSGVIYSNGIAPLPYGMVVALAGTDSGNQNYAGAAVADANGNYQLNLAPGSYFLSPISPGYFTDQSLTPALTLTNSQNITNNLFLTNGTVSISGSVLGYNAASTNTPGAVLLQFTSGSLMAVAITDTNGNYTAGVSPNYWKITLSRERLARRQYVVSTSKIQVNTTAGSVANVTNIIYGGTGLFYGQIMDNSNNPFANLEFDGGDSNALYDAKGFSDLNGNYAVAVLTFLPSDGWNVNPNSTANYVLTNYIVNSTGFPEISSGQTIQQNFVCLPITASISGRVLEQFFGPVAGIGLFASATINGLAYQSANFNTDSSGDYLLGVTIGDWTVQFITSTAFGNNSLQSFNLLDLSGPHYVSIPPTNVTLNLTLYTNTTPYIDSENRVSHTQFAFLVHGATNVNYTVQVSTNLASSWAGLQSFELITNPIYIMDANATNSPRFYRVQQN